MHATGADRYVGRKEETQNEIQWHCEEWMEKHRDMEGERGKGDGHQHGR